MQSGAQHGEEVGRRDTDLLLLRGNLPERYPAARSLPPQRSLDVPVRRALFGERNRLWQGPPGFATHRDHRGHALCPPATARSSSSGPKARREGEIVRQRDATKGHPSARALAPSPPRWPPSRADGTTATRVHTGRYHASTIANRSSRAAAGDRVLFGRRARGVPSNPSRLDRFAPPPPPPQGGGDAVRKLRYIMHRRAARRCRGGRRRAVPARVRREGEMSEVSVRPAVARRRKPNLATRGGPFSPFAAQTPMCSRGADRRCRPCALDQQEDPPRKVPEPPSGRAPRAPAPVPPGGRQRSGEPPACSPLEP